MQTLVVPGGVLKRLREGLGWSQTEAAERYGISRAHLAHIERGAKQPSPAVAKRMAEVLGMPLGDLVRQDVAS